MHCYVGRAANMVTKSVTKNPFLIKIHMVVQQMRREEKHEFKAMFWGEMAEFCCFSCVPVMVCEFCTQYNTVLQT